MNVTSAQGVNFLSDQSSNMGHPIQRIHTLLLLKVGNKENPTIYNQPYKARSSLAGRSAIFVVPEVGIKKEKSMIDLAFFLVKALSRSFSLFFLGRKRVFSLKIFLF